MDNLVRVEQELQRKFAGGSGSRLPSTAELVERKTTAETLFLPEAERGRMPLTKSKYLVRENPELVAWERETRLFLRQLSPSHEHRVSAVMVFEWVTGIEVKGLMEEGGSTADLKHINKILRFYFGKSYRTTICGRKVPNAYKVKRGTYITRRRPMNLELYAEFLEGTLYP